jgi:hypothetical protein
MRQARVAAESDVLSPNVLVGIARGVGSPCVGEDPLGFDHRLVLDLGQRSRNRCVWRGQR